MRLSTVDAKIARLQKKVGDMRNSVVYVAEKVPGANVEVLERLVDVVETRLMNLYSLKRKLIEHEGGDQYV